MANKIKLKRGLSSKISSITLDDGEVALTTDTNKLYSKKGEIALNNAISPKFLYIYFLKRLFFLYKNYNNGLRYCPVNDFSTFATCSGVPLATIVPPPSPPSGPRSIR